MKDEDKEKTTEAIELAQEIEPMLAGKGPEIQGAVLAQLAAVFIAGHHPDIREDQLLLLAETIHRLVPPTARAKFGPEGWPFPLTEPKAWTN